MRIPKRVINDFRSGEDIIRAGAIVYVVSEEIPGVDPPCVHVDTERGFTTPCFRSNLAPLVKTKAESEQRRDELKTQVLNHDHVATRVKDSIMKFPLAYGIRDFQRLLTRANRRKEEHNGTDQ